MFACLADAPPSRLLDLASGTGEPALFFARSLPGAQVTATDLAADILTVGEELARSASQANIEFRQASADSLPFADCTFDAITCRWGAMFFPNLRAALRECRRVLQPAGRIVMLAWCAIGEQPFFLHTVGTLRKQLGLPLEESEDEPNPFCLRRPEKLAEALTSAGFGDVSAQSHTLEFAWPGPPREPWTFWTEISSSYRAPLDSLTEDERRSLGESAEAAFRRFYDGTAVRVPARVMLATGVRP
ncbi:MAG: class I SAM-dependent methyltransferase [Candidatus Acidiferrales bacterium]